MKINYNRLMLSLIVLVGSTINASKRCHKPVDLKLLNQLDNVLANNNPLQFNNDTFLPGQGSNSGIDPIVAVGPKSVCTMVNSLIGFHRKSTFEELFLIDTTSFFEGLPRVNEFSMYDPWVVYDEFSERFWLVAFKRSENENGREDSNYYFAVSKNSNPKSPDDFFKYYYSTDDIPGEDITRQDYPKIAVDREALYMSVILTDSPRFGNEIVVFDKATLLNGSLDRQQIDSLNRIPTENFGQQEFVFPCQPRKSSCGEVEKVLFVQAKLLCYPLKDRSFADLFGNSLRVYQVKNPTSPGGASLQYAEVSVPPFACQFGSRTFITQPAPLMNTYPPENPRREIRPLSQFMGRILSTALANNSIWACHTIYTDTCNIQGRSVTRWYQLDVSKFLTDNKVSLVQSGEADPGGTTNQIFASINVDKDENMAIQFTLVGEQQYPVIAYTGRLKCDPKGTVRLPLQLAKGGDLYYQVQANEIGATDPDDLTGNRWTDYSGLAIDPCDHKTFYLFNARPLAVDPFTPSVFNGIPQRAWGFGVTWTTFLGVFQVNECGETINAPKEAANIKMQTCPNIQCENGNGAGKAMTVKSKNK